MRKAIIFAGGITHLLNLISITTDEQDLKIYIDAFSSLPIDGILQVIFFLVFLLFIFFKIEDGVSWIYHDEKSLSSLVCLLYSSNPKVKTMTVNILSKTLTNGMFFFDFKTSY